MQIPEKQESRTHVDEKKNPNKLHMCMKTLNTEMQSNLCFLFTLISWLSSHGKYKRKKNGNSFREKKY